MSDYVFSTTKMLLIRASLITSNHFDALDNNPYISHYGLPSDYTQPD